MKLSKLAFAVATVLTTTSAFALDLYVDTKTKQIYTEAGVGRQKLGSFEQVQDDIPVKRGGEVSALREKVELQDNQIKALEEHAKASEEEGLVEIKKDGGIEFKSRDGNFKMAINGRVQVDSQMNVNQDLPSSAGGFAGAGGAAGTMPATLNDGAGLRRARLGVEGTFFKNTDYKFEYDFTRGNGLNAGGITDAYIRQNFSKPFSVKVGAFKEPFSMEEATSNRYTTFIERNMATNTFIDNLNTYKVGIGANYTEERWGIATSLQTEGVGGYNNAYGSNNKFDSATTGSAINSNGGVNRNGGGGDTGWEVNARVTGMPWMESKTKFLHLGTSGSYINVNNNYKSDGSFSNGGIVFANGLGSNIDRSGVLSTSNLSSGTKGTTTYLQANHLTRYGAESALVYGPFSAQGEYIQTDISGAGYHDESLSGYYGYMTYFLTGESRAYKSSTGAWDRLKPTRNFDMKGGWGAWELASGYDSINLNDGVIRGGRVSTAKVGVNWYPNPHMRVMTNYVHALDINTAGRKGNTAFNNADL
ncbi:MAG: porin, partial [Methylococcales bacterium]|nr:porin [Methylococcales bacterium]